MQKLEEGDLFERSHAEWLRRRLGGYEEVWSRYIGNDGTSHPMEIKGLDLVAQHDRKMFCQSHYSLGLFAFLFDRLTTRAVAETKESKEAGLTQECDSYLRDTENITLFLAYMGQICDMVEEIARSLKAKDIAKQVGDFMKERNNAIHAARIPMGEDHRGVKIAAIAPNDEACGEYRNRIPWDTVDVLKFKPLAEWMATTRDRLFEALNRPVYPMILKAVRDRFDGREVTPRTLAAAEPIKVTVNLPPGSVYSVYQAPLGTWHGGTMVADISGKK